jgi:hypothetical protein
MARKLCEFCNTRPATSQNRGNISIQACEPCETEAGFENEHADGQCGGVEGGRCWICLPELNEAQATYVKQERKGHHSPRRPQINHRACSHAQTPLARRACRKAFWAAKAQEAPAPVLTATYEGLVEWDGKGGKVHQGNIIRDLGAGKMLVRTASQRPTPVRVAFAALRIAG